MLLLRAGRTDCASFTRRSSRSLAVSSNRPLVSCFWQGKVPSSGQNHSGVVVGGRRTGCGGGVTKKKQQKNKKKTTKLRRNTTRKVIHRVGIFL